MRFLHMGDLHLDSPFASIADPMKAAQRREELNGCVQAVIDYAKQREIGIVLIAGDFFDNEQPRIGLFRAVMEQMGRAGGIRFFIAPGNHDYYHSRSLYALEPLPENVTVFGGEVEQVELEEGVVLYGRGFTHAHEPQSLLHGFQAQTQQPSIFLVHGELGQAGDYGPIVKEEIANSGVTYLALGHIHQYSGIQREGATTWAYPGIPMGRGFDEMGQKGFISGEIDQHGVRLAWVPLAGREYREVQVDVSDFVMAEEIAKEIRMMLEREGSEHIYRVILTGTRPAPGVVDAALLEKMVQQSAFHVEVQDATQAAVQWDMVAKESSLRGIFVRRMQQRVRAADSEEERELCRLAWQLGWDNLK